ncbi:MAG: HD domain-containing phosphohydrolase [Mariprofundaceae bacterium]|nr:HD domain-containing phosphohydrolase [Mariprofundaceae bacterium]
MPKYIDLLRNHSFTENKTDGIEELPLQDEHPRTDAKKAKTATTPKKSTKKSTKAVKNDKTVDISDPEAWLAQCARIMLSLLKASSKRRVVRANKLWRHLKPQIEVIIEERSQLSVLELKLSENTQRIRDMSEDFGGMLEKSMNMLLLSVKIGLQLRMPNEKILSLLLAAMLHHVGLAQVSAAIRQKSVALTREDRQAIRDAMHQGVAYLRDCGIDDEDTLYASEQSQERMDGSGPLGLKGPEISYLARIVGILSFFEAMVHYRPYRQRMLPRDAIREIILHHKNSFDTVILKALIDAVSLYPIGTYVQLNSGDIGQVIHVHPRLPLRPTVMLRLDRHQHPIAPREIDLQVQTTLQVEKCMYPEDLEHAV